MNSSRRKFLLHGGAAALSLGLLPSISRAGNTIVPERMRAFARMSPESQGVSSSAISKFISAAQASGLEWHGFMMLRHGNVIAEGWWKPFGPDYKHTLYSLSKSFTSTAIGILIKEGKIKVEEPVIGFFPDELPSDVSENLRQMTIRNLLTMNTGHAADTTPKMREGTDAWTKTFLSLPVEHKPGSHFLYNSGATYMLGAIVKKVSGEDLERFLTPRLFDPLEIKDHDWEKSPQGLSVAGWGLRVKTEDIAKLGQLYLQKGKWNGKEILTETWVEDASSRQTNSNTGASDWSQGYGYQFWRCTPGFFRGDGAFGQFCVVMPQHDVVVVVNSQSFDMQKQMTIMWQTLLPGIQPTALKEEPGALKKLKTELSTLSLPVTSGSLKPELVKKYNNKRIDVAANDFGVSGVTLNLNENRCSLLIDTAKGKQSIEAGWQAWVTGKDNGAYPFVAAPGNIVPTKRAASATWSDNNTLKIDLKFVEANHGDKITFVFEGDRVSIEFLSNVAENGKNNSEKRSKLVGTVI